MLSYLTPLTLFITYKGVNKHAMLASWSVASVASFGLLIYMGWWHDIWTVLTPLLWTPFIAYEVERSKISFFLQVRPSPI